MVEGAKRGNEDDGGVTQFVRDAQKLRTAIQALSAEGRNDVQELRHASSMEHSRREYREEEGEEGYSSTSMNHSSNTFWSRKSEMAHAERTSKG
jgi:hypothetical protein